MSKFREILIKKSLKVSSFQRQPIKW